MVFRRKSAPPAEFPFVARGRLPAATLPLKPSFRFVHEPLLTGGAVEFVGRSEELKELTMRVLFSNGGSFLITGYRGVGKSSFVNQVLASIDRALLWAQPLIGPTRAITVQLSLARPLEPIELMYYIRSKE